MTATAPFVVAVPMVAPAGYGSGGLSVSVDHRVVALVLHPVDQPELRMLLRPADADAIGRQMLAAAAKLGGPAHA